MSSPGARQGDGDGRVCAIVTTRQGGRPLAACLAALAAQTRLPDEVLVLGGGDQARWPASAGETRLRIRRLPPPRSGQRPAMRDGIREAGSGAFEWLWLLDDEPLAAPGALAALLRASAAVAELGAPALLAAKVLAPDGAQDALGGAVPDYRRVERIVEAVPHGVLPIRSAGFASALVAASAVARQGLPWAGDAAWRPEAEFTARLVRHGAGYLVAESVVRRQHPGPSSGVRDAVRNALWTARSPAWTPRERVDLHVQVVVENLLALRGPDGTARRAAALLRGLWAGLRPRAVSD